MASSTCRGSRWAPARSTEQRQHGFPQASVLDRRRNRTVGAGSGGGVRLGFVPVRGTATWSRRGLSRSHPIGGAPRRGRRALAADAARLAERGGLRPWGGGHSVWSPAGKSRGRCGPLQSRGQPGSTGCRTGWVPCSLTRGRWGQNRGKESGDRCSGAPVLWGTHRSSSPLLGRHDKCRRVTLVPATVLPTARNASARQPSNSCCQTR